MALPGLPSSNGIGALLPVAVAVFGIVNILRQRRAHKQGPDSDEDAKRRREAAQEMERRMASYLASRDTGGRHDRADTGNEQETGR